MAVEDQQPVPATPQRRNAEKKRRKLISRQHLHVVETDQDVAVTLSQMPRRLEHHIAAPPPRAGPSRNRLKSPSDPLCRVPVFPESSGTTGLPGLCGVRGRAAENAIGSAIQNAARNAGQRLAAAVPIRPANSTTASRCSSGVSAAKRGSRTLSPPRPCAPVGADVRCRGPEMSSVKSRRAGGRPCLWLGAKGPPTIERPIPPPLCHVRSGNLNSVITVKRPHVSAAYSMARRLPRLVRAMGEPPHGWHDSVAACHGRAASSTAKGQSRFNAVGQEVVGTTSLVFRQDGMLPVVVEKVRLTWPDGDW